MGEKGVQGSEISHAEESSQHARGHAYQAGGATLGHDASCDDEDRHPKDPRVARHLDGQAKGNLGDDNQCREERQQDQLKCRKGPFLHQIIRSRRWAQAC
jgi:hypothetical protein